MTDKKGGDAVAATMIDDLKDSGSDKQESLAHQNFRGKSDEEVAALKKRLLRKVDFRVMPMLIILFLLKYVFRADISTESWLTAPTAFWIATTSPTPGSEVSKMT